MDKVGLCCDCDCYYDSYFVNNICFVLSVSQTMSTTTLGGGRTTRFSCSARNSQRNAAESKKNYILKNRQSHRPYPNQSMPKYEHCSPLSHGPHSKTGSLSDDLNQFDIENQILTSKRMITIQLDRFVVHLNHNKN